MTAERRRHIDITSVPDHGADAASESAHTESRRCWIGIHFECCGVYTRVYRDPAAPEYEGRCPRCGCRVTLRVGPDGVNSRIFRARPR